MILLYFIRVKEKDNVCRRCGGELNPKSTPQKKRSSSPAYVLTMVLSKRNASAVNIFIMVIII